MYRSPNIFRVIKSRIWTDHVVRMEEGRSAFKILTEKPTGGPSLRWEDNIRIGLKEIDFSTRN